MECGPVAPSKLANSLSRGFGHTRINGGESEKPMEKQSLSRRFSRFFRFDFFFGGLGGVQPLSRAPRLGTSGDFFGSFLVGQKGTYPGSAKLPDKPPHFYQ